MKPSTRIVWLGYGSIAFALVWGVPGLLMGYYAHKLRKEVVPVANLSHHERRDVRGGILLSRIGMALSAIVLAVVVFSWISGF